VTETDAHAGERAAREARRRYGLPSTGPVEDLLRLCERRVGVPVLIDRFDTEAVAGVLLRSRGEGDFIAVNADVHAVRQRFTLAHELGHIFMNHEGRVDLSRDVGGSASDPQEIEANYFAAEFLAPRDAIREWIDDEGLSRAPGDPEVLARLALTFGVARQTACYRLERAGLITFSQKRALLGDLAEEVTQRMRAFSAERLWDSIEQLHREGSYPRVPHATVSFARQALSDGLIDDEEYQAIAGAAPPGPDLDGWLE
jgi:Zn-dependent peptidase ImmA (M78 family)